MNSNSLTFQPLPIGARELSVQENHDVAGGLLPLAAIALWVGKAFVAGLFTAATSNYLY